jgi:hypothetical protein
MHLQHSPDDSHTQLNRSEQLRELVVARWQYAVLYDTGRNDIELGWYEYVRGVSKFRKGKLTWPNVRAASHEGSLFAKFGDDAGWRTVISDPTNDQMMECLRDVNTNITEIVELLLYEVFE